MPQEVGFSPLWIRDRTECLNQGEAWTLNAPLDTGLERLIHRWLAPAERPALIPPAPLTRLASQSCAWQASFTWSKIRSLSKVGGMRLMP